MKKSDKKPVGETLEQELKRLRKENERLRAKMEADKAKFDKFRKDFKKKEDPKLRLTEEQIQQLSNLFPDIDFRSKS